MASSGKDNLNIEEIKIEHFEKLPSTNSRAMKFAKFSEKDCLIIRADIQTHGRGRRDRVWYSERGGVWFSMILRPDMKAKDGFFLTMVSSTAVVETLDIYGIDSRVKWPNDVLVDGKKICGVLSEFETQDGKITYAVVGIGLNVNNELPEYLGDIGTTMKQVSDVEFDKNEVFEKLLDKFTENYNLLLRSRETIREKWTRYSDMIDKMVKVTTEDEEFIGAVVDIDLEGRLVLQSGEEKKTISTGDLEYL